MGQILEQLLETLAERIAARLTKTGAMPACPQIEPVEAPVVRT